MKRTSYVTCFIIIIIYITSCSPISKKDSVFPYKQIKYDVYTNKQEQKIGTLTYVFVVKNDIIEVEETKEYNGKFFGQEEETVKNIKTYTTDKNFKLLSLLEKEYLNNELHFETSHQVKETSDYYKVNIDTNGKKLSRALPKDVQISSYSSGQFSIVYNEDINVNNYYFFINSFGYVEAFNTEKKEKVDSIFGKVDTYKIVNDTMHKYIVWVDKTNKIIIKKIEYLDSEFEVRCELAEIERSDGY